MVYLVAMEQQPPSGWVPPLLVRPRRHHHQPRHGQVEPAGGRHGRRGPGTAASALIANRWLGSVMGEGIVYDLQVKLYTHVQQNMRWRFTRTRPDHS